MSRLIQLVVVAFSLLFFMQAQASIDVTIGSECAIFADESTKTDDGKKEGGDKKEGEEEEPECD
ncbi:MAG: hypothetical protein OEY06_09565 [Gammaproteobacteria bacterium]|nr:hypothetical protein [Gammaproteobacteria bacterium]